VSFVPLPPPRLIFVGVTDRLLEVTRSAKAIGRGCGGFDFWASTPVCGPRRRHSFVRRRDPALGFASCRVIGHFAVQRSGLDPACDHQPPDRAADDLLAADARPIRSWAFATLLPITHLVPRDAASPGPRFVIGEGLSLRRGSPPPFSVLMGLMPCPA
jgi:hypothetical protein